MKVAIFTLCRDRLAYSQHCFELLWQKAGHLYDHYVIDNGSEDGTVDWLMANRHRFKRVVFNGENEGIGVACNMALDLIGTGYDLICKMDNDCEIVTPDLVAKMVAVYSGAGGQPFLLSPRVEGIRRQPKRDHNVNLAGHIIGRTGIVGGLCHWLQADVYQRYRYSTKLPKAWGNDGHFCDWAYRQRIPIGYVEELVVNHLDTTDGQALKYPDYFERKFREEKA